MKECPTCQQLFTDGNLRFCRYDGTPLVSKAARPDEALTIQLPTGKLKPSQKGAKNTKEE